MTITLTPELKEIVRRRVELGGYDDSLDVVREALLQMDDRERLEALRAAVDRAREQIARGEGIPYTQERRAAIRQRARDLEATNAPRKADVLP